MDAVRQRGERYREIVVRLLDRERVAEHVDAQATVEVVLIVAGMPATELARIDPADRERVAGGIRALLRRALAP